MTSIFRHRVVWTGFAGAPGFSNLYLSSTGHNPDVRTLFNSVAAYVPSGVTFTFDALAAEIDSSTGDIISMTAAGAAAPVICAGAGNYALPSGAVVRWLTGQFVNGRQVQGRTFFVPFSGLDSAGTLLAAAITALQGAAATYVGANPAVVWTRPTPTVAGSVHSVTSALVPDKCVVLRSRRD